MKKGFLSVLLSVCMVAGLAGCGEKEKQPEVYDTGKEDEETKVSATPQNENGNGSTAQPGTIQGDIVQGDVSILRNGVNAFAYEMYDHLEEGEDLFFSPYSLCTALSLLNVGAGSDTQSELEAMLGIEDRNAWNGAVRAYLETEWPENTFVLTANSVWLQAGHEWAPDIEKDFLQPAGYFYMSEMYEVDFEGQPQDAVDKMNGWADENTRGMIPRIVNKIPEDTVMALMNAVYFEGKWEEPFLEEKTYEQTFYGTDGEKQVDMMHQYGEYYAYVESNGMKGIALPYKDADVVMKVFIPLEEGTDIETIFNALSTEEKEALLDSLDTAAREEIETLALPKFTMEKGIEDLNGILQDMGMETAFLPDADFDSIGEGIYVTDVLHKAKIEVDEEGTTAAAVTVIMNAECAAIMEEIPVTFIADRPFVYVLQDTETGMILFMGRVNNLE